jgi:hypothetical protein
MSAITSSRQRCAEFLPMITPQLPALSASSAEYGLTADKGYTVADPNLDDCSGLQPAGRGLLGG